MGLKAVLPDGSFFQEFSLDDGARARNVLARAEGSTGRALFDAAVAGGAAALGVAAPALTPGAPADLVSLDDTHPRLVQRGGDAVLDSWIFSAGNAAVDGVWVAGRKRVEGGRHLARDAVAQRFRAAVTRMAERQP